MECRAIENEILSVAKGRILTEFSDKVFCKVTPNGSMKDIVIGVRLSEKDREEGSATVKIDSSIEPWIMERVVGTICGCLNKSLSGYWSAAR